MSKKLLLKKMRRHPWQYGCPGKCCNIHKRPLLSGRRALRKWLRTILKNHPGHLCPACGKLRDHGQDEEGCQGEAIPGGLRLLTRRASYQAFALGERCGMSPGSVS